MIEQMIGKRIQGLREIKEWTQIELAKRSDVSRSFLGGLERGESQPTIGVLHRIAQALGVSVSYFVEEEQEVAMRQFAGLLPDDIQALLASGEGLPYLRLAAKAKDWALNPEVLESIIVNIRRARE